MGLVQSILKSYYLSRGYDIVFRKFKIHKDGLGQAINLPRATYAPWLDDNEFMNLFNQLGDHTLVDIYRSFELWQLTHEVKDLEGDYIEIGVWRGGTGTIIAKRASLNSDSASVFLCDTFEGVVKAGEMDNKYVGEEHADTSQELVETLLKSHNINNAKLLKGIFPDDTGDAVKEMRFKLCHIDVDVYEGAKQCTEYLWNQMVIGGIIIYDDYGFSGTQGVTKFVNSQKGMRDRIVLHNLNGHGIIIKVA